MCQGRSQPFKKKTKGQRKSSQGDANCDKHPKATSTQKKQQRVVTSYEVVGANLPLGNILDGNR